MKEPTMIFVKLPLGEGQYLTVEQAQNHIDKIKSMIYDSWESKEDVKHSKKWWKEFEASNRQFPDELFLPKS